MEDFVNEIKKKLQERDFNSSFVGLSIIDDYNYLLNRNDKLMKQLDNMRYENSRIRTHSQASSPKSESNVSKKVYELQEEITKIVKEKASLDVQIYKLKLEITEKEKQIRDMEQKINDLKSQLSNSGEINRKCGESIKKLEDVKRTMADEISANLLAYRSLDAKCKSLEESNYILKETVKKLQQNLEERKNEEYDKTFRERQEAVKKSLQEAANTSVDFTMTGSSIVLTGLPSRMSHNIDAHEGEMGCIRFSPSGQYLASSGADRKVKIWNVTNNMCENVMTLSGCNGAVVCVDWEPSGADSLILGCSTLDSSCRVWGIPDGRLRLSLTGHSNKVVVGRFLDSMTNGLMSSGRIVTGSTDRTMKLWDAKNRVCIRTVLAMSSVHDVAVSTAVSMLISGHFDRKLRFWDSRKAELQTEHVNIPGRITGLALNPADGGISLVACTRDPPDLQTVDLRMLRPLHSFTNEGKTFENIMFSGSGSVASTLINPTGVLFKPGMEYVKPSYSPDGQYIACGGHEGHVFIWNVKTGRLEKVLGREHTSTIVAVHWSTTNNLLASCERNKKVVLWQE